MSPKLLALLQALVKNNGSDLHLSSLSVPMIRIRGDLEKTDLPPMQPKDLMEMCQSIMSERQRNEFEKEHQVDFAIYIKDLGNFRINFFLQKNGISAVFRNLPSQPPTLESLRLPAICRMACNFPNGLVLVTGPTGSGKSTTLAAMINYINMTEKSHIITLEDPIEFQHESKLSMVNQRQLGDHFTDFRSALKVALREDPDVILVGEMRDQETIQLAITAAETGHLVFATLHTNSAAKSLDRIIDSFEGGVQSQIRSMLSESLRVIISQKLVPTADGKSRMAFHDILVNNAAVANLIREQKIFQIPSIMQTARREGMQVLDHALLDGVRSHLISGEVAWEYANEKALFTQWAPKEFTSLGEKTNLGTTKAGEGTATLKKAS